MFSFYYFILLILIWKAISIYFLSFHCWILKELKTAKVWNHSVSAYQLFTQMTGPVFNMFTGAMFIFTSVTFLNMCKPRKGWPTSTGILWKWASKPNELAGDGEWRLPRFHPIRNFLANEIYHLSRLSHQTGCHRILKLGFLKFKPIFLRMQFSLVATFFL